MNLNCTVRPQTNIERLKAIERGLNDLEYWSPCEVAPMLALEYIRRVEAPFGGYYYEITERGYKLLAANERLEATGEIA